MPPRRTTRHLAGPLMLALCAIIAAAPLRPADRDVAVRDGRLTVVVSGFTSKRGQLMLALHNSKATFLTRRGPFRTGKLPITADTMRFAFHDVPAGTYSVSVFHDENANDDLDGVLRIPTERYGFSRNPRSRFGPPGYDDTTFPYSGGDTAIVIALRDAISR